MKNAPSLRIDFEPVDKTVVVETQTRILDAARKAGIDIPAACGGNGKCGTCRIKIESGAVSDPTAEERELLSEAELGQGYRLACCTNALGDLIIRLPKESLSGSHRLQVDGGDRQWPVDPVITQYEIEVSQPSLHDSRADLERVVDVMDTVHNRPNLTADIPVVNQLSQQLRKYEWHLNTLVRGDRLIGFSAPGSRLLGLAVDLGGQSEHRQPPPHRAGRST